MSHAGGTVVVRTGTHDANLERAFRALYNEPARMPHSRRGAWFNTALAGFNAVVWIYALMQLAA